MTGQIQAVAPPVSLGSPAVEATITAGPGGADAAADATVTVVERRWLEVRWETVDFVRVPTGTVRHVELADGRCVDLTEYRCTGTRYEERHYEDWEFTAPVGDYLDWLNSSSSVEGSSVQLAGTLPEGTPVSIGARTVLNFGGRSFGNPPDAREIDSGWVRVGDGSTTDSPTYEWDSSDPYPCRQPQVPTATSHNAVVTVQVVDADTGQPIAGTVTTVGAVMAATSGNGGGGPDVRSPGAVITDPMAVNQGGDTSGLSLIVTVGQGVSISHTPQAGYETVRNSSGQNPPQTVYLTAENPDGSYSVVFYDRPIPMRAAPGGGGAPPPAAPRDATPPQVTPPPEPPPGQAPPAPATPQPQGVGFDASGSAPTGEAQVPAPAGDEGLGFTIPQASQEVTLSLGEGSEVVVAGSPAPSTAPTMAPVEEASVPPDVLVDHIVLRDPEAQAGDDEDARALIDGPQTWGSRVRDIRIKPAPPLLACASILAVAVLAVAVFAVVHHGSSTPPNTVASAGNGSRAGSTGGSTSPSLRLGPVVTGPLQYVSIQGTRTTPAPVTVSVQSTATGETIRVDATPPTGVTGSTCTDFTKSLTPAGVLRTQEVLRSCGGGVTGPTSGVTITCSPGLPLYMAAWQVGTPVPFTEQCASASNGSQGGSTSGRGWTDAGTATLTRLTTLDGGEYATVVRRYTRQFAGGTSQQTFQIQETSLIRVDRWEEIGTETVNTVTVQGQQHSSSSAFLLQGVSPDVLALLPPPGAVTTPAP